MDINPPFLLVETVKLECAGDAERFDPVNVLIPPVIAFANVALTVFVGETAAECFTYGETAEVFTRDEFEAVVLAGVFEVDEVVEFRVGLLEVGHWE